MPQTKPQARMPPVPTRLRQIALVASDLERAAHLLERKSSIEIPWLSNGDCGIYLVVSPFKSNTTAGRLLSKRGDGGYMVIMQTEDAAARRDYVQSNKLAKVIFNHESEDFVCIQYHPKGIKGGIIPELDSHSCSPTNPTPLQTRFSPWHACGPPTTYPRYAAGMKRHSALHLLSATCRLAPGDADVEGAARQWEDVFGVVRGRRTGESGFVNARLGFVAGVLGESGGLVEVGVGVDGDVALSGILERAERMGVLGRDGAVEMLGVRWKFVLLGEDVKSRL
ncbi:hypothetical protein LAWI1_G003566 [Lachnellula willkommii]|uniref:Glyoxalase-like domain-containing protein n=1 Tax=Lachnellula willkommii TaxID=215461 RepID=A0A559M839_9HELO|nr:hypothetical protein LAWI1_G003566 [Lachnellula willkommii]